MDPTTNTTDCCAEFADGAGPGKQSREQEAVQETRSDAPSPTTIGTSEDGLSSMGDQSNPQSNTFSRESSVVDAVESGNDIGQAPSGEQKRRSDAFVKQQDAANPSNFESPVYGSHQSQKTMSALANTGSVGEATCHRSQRSLPSIHTLGLPFQAARVPAKLNLGRCPLGHRHRRGSFSSDNELHGPGFHDCPYRFEPFTWDNSGTTPQPQPPPQPQIYAPASLGPNIPFFYTTPVYRSPYSHAASGPARQTSRNQLGNHEESLFHIPSQRGGDGRRFKVFLGLKSRVKEVLMHCLRSFRNRCVGSALNDKDPVVGVDLSHSILLGNSSSVVFSNLHISNFSNRADGEVTMLGAGESYRPAGGRPRSPPPRADTFRADRDRSPRRDRARTPLRDRQRSPPYRERARTPPPASDSYYPGSRNRSPIRRRSRTPPYRSRDRTPARDVPNWRARDRPRSPFRPRSPRNRSPPRARSPFRARSPPRNRSPFRARSPPRRFSPRREDDRRERPRSPLSPRRRSRSPYERDRPSIRVRSPVRSPPRRARSRTPERRDNRAPIGPSSSNGRRPRSPSPARDSERSSGRTSGNNSRRSSPPAHPSRVVLAQAASRDEQSSHRSPSSREMSPPQHANLSYRDSGRESARSTPRERSPARPPPRSPPRGPAGFRPPPTGPSAGRNFTAPARSPLSTTSNNPPQPSNQNRPETVPVAPPTGPRAAPRGPSYMRGGRGSFSGDRSTRPDQSSWGNPAPSRTTPDIMPRASAPVSRAAATVSPTSSVPTGPAAIPTGPRAGPSGPARPNLQPASGVYGRTQSFATPPHPRAHPAMTNLPPIIPGGRIDPALTGLSAEIDARLKKRQQEEEVLRADLELKQENLRRGMKQWDKLSKDSQSWGLRSQLSERHVRTLAGEGIGGAAF
ncbi:hypothetical protein BP6252_00080 [Coleophoma cylindrospora]|uniref:Uncharacterized protein n=1 Tax=Coleophoma cylindrospora TaxID=1849047 RepID=A0A3D8SQH7_9HELO|nr:hypothetical protein BP6252_00080 [Coleophoma cylindrospora]